MDPRGRDSGRPDAGARPATRATLAVAACALLLLAWPVATRADHLDNSVNWPELLPPNPDNSAATVSLGFDACPSGGVNCPKRVIKEMYKRWEPLDASCDHKAVFALTYLRTTEEYLRTVTHQPDFFDDLSWINREDAIFAELYFRAYDAWHAGKPVPGAWRVAFQAAESGDVTATGDLLLGMNAHIQRDLPYTLAAVGLVDPEGGSRKLDHDRVNHFLQRVADPLQEELADRYDPLFTITDASPSPFDEMTVLEAVRGMRESAWRNAERLVNARTSLERSLVTASIEEQATTAALAIRAGNTVPGYGATRDAWCRR